MTIRRITPQTSLDNLKTEAKRRLKNARAGGSKATLREIQLEIAREYGFPGWPALKRALDRSLEVEKYDRLAADMVTAYATGDPDSIARINQHYERSSTVDDFRATVWALIYKVRRAKGAPEAFQLEEAQELISRIEGFPNWSALKVAVAKGDPPPVPAYIIDAKENRIAARRDLHRNDWDALIDAILQHRIAHIDSHGFLTDDALRRIARMDHVKSLQLEGCRQITEGGLRYLADMPQLETLDLTTGNITDRSLDVLRHLPNLRNFKMVWQNGISDVGVANLKYCDKLEKVDLMGSRCGDGAIDALRGKPNLYHLDTGRLVTDAGLAHLHDFPLFKHWHRETRLMIDGPFTNAGLAALAGLDGVYELDLFWHVTAITSAAFAVLPTWANLGALGCDGELANDEAMRHIGSIPRLKRLRAQGSVATDEGFIALAQSQSIEQFWGREAPNLTGRGFRAFSRMPALRSLGVSCMHVDDAALSTLPHFPVLRELIPIDVQDAGFRHVGRCLKLERLSCMYCRDTTDAATEWIANLQINSYYAGLTKITDRSLEILGRMNSLEQIEFYETKSVTDAGLQHIAKLPNLREVRIFGLPKVTHAGIAQFPARVRVEYEV